MYHLVVVSILVLDGKVSKIHWIFTLKSRLSVLNIEFIITKNVLKLN